MEVKECGKCEKKKYCEIGRDMPDVCDYDRGADDGNDRCNDRERGVAAFRRETGSGGHDVSGGRVGMPCDCNENGKK